MNNREICAPRHLRWVALFALIVMLLLSFISLMAWWSEGAAMGLWTLPLWLSMVGYWLWQWSLWDQRFRLYADLLEIGHLDGSVTRLKYPNLQALHLERGRLHLSTAQRTVRIRGDAMTLAQVATELESRIPLLQKASESPVLPIQVNAPSQPVILATLFGLLFGIVAIPLAVTAIQDVERRDRLFLLLFAAAMLLLAGAALYWLLIRFVWHYRFDRNLICVRHTLRTVQYDPTSLSQLTMQQRLETARNLSKTLYWLQMRFSDGQELRVQPGAQNYPFEYNEVYEHLILTRLQTQLTHLYASSVDTQAPQSEPMMQPIHDPVSPVEAATSFVSQRPIHDDNQLALHTDDDWGMPHFGRELFSQAADLRVTLLNFGERQPAAENVLIVLSRPVPDAPKARFRFRTTNGNASFSPSGAILLIQTPFLLVAIDAQTMQAWHYTLPKRTMLLSADWQGEQVQATIAPYDHATPQTLSPQTLGPWSWQTISEQWQAGVGRLG